MFVVGILHVVRSYVTPYHITDV